MAKGFKWLLKKGIPFHWDQVAQSYFDVVKNTLVWASLMYPPNYQSDYFLYIIVANMIVWSERTVLVCCAKCHFSYKTCTYLSPFVCLRIEEFNHETYMKL